MNMNHMCGIFLFSNSRCSVEPRAWTVSFRKHRKFQQTQEPKKVGRSSGPACSHRSDVVTAILSQLELLSVTEATSALLQLQDITRYYKCISYKHCREIIEDLSGNALGIEAAEAGLKFGGGCFTHGGSHGKCDQNGWNMANHGESWWIMEVR